MKKRGWKWLVALVGILFACAFTAACAKAQPVPQSLDYLDPDLAGANASTLEAAARYQTRFKNGSINIGDVMPYYENGVYHIFYLAEGGGNAGHPIYRADTTDFVHFEDKGKVLSPGASTSQDSMIGTGSVEKVNGEYYFFYTGFLKDNPEAVMVAKSSDLMHFEKQDNFRLFADPSLQGWDFRDPEAVFDGEKIHLFISAKKDNAPVIVRYEVSPDLTSVTYKGVVFTDTRFGANVLECPDLFKINQKWYLTYSVQDVSNGGGDGQLSAQASVGTNGKMFYAAADSMTGPFTHISADSSLDSMAFYAGKTAQDGDNTYLAGWVRQKGANAGWQYNWGGNLLTHQLTANVDGTLNVSLPQSVRNYYSVERAPDKILQQFNGLDLIAENKNYHVVTPEYSSYLLQTVVRFDSETTEFGFALAVSSNTANIMEIAFIPSADKIRSGMNARQETASKNIFLQPDRDYFVTLLIEGSVVTVYVDNSVAFTARIRNIGNKKCAVYAKDGSVSFRDFHIFTPSGYVDTLSAGQSGLKITSEGQELLGKVNSVTAAPSSPAEIRYTASEDNFVRYSLSCASDEAAKVEISYDGAVKESISLHGLQPAQHMGTAFLKKNQTVTLRFSASNKTKIHIAAAFETDKKPFDSETVANVSAEDAPARFVAGEDGTYAYTATVLYEGDEDTLPVFYAGQSKVNLSKENCFAVLRGAVKLRAGEDFSAYVGFNTAKLGKCKIALKVYSGFSEFSSGVGVLTQPISTNCIASKSIVPSLKGDFTVESGRGMNAEMNGSSFGEQGKGGFVYAYGKEGNELFPMTEYNTNGEIWEYKHKAPEASDALEIKADYMKQNSAYVTAVAWIAPKDGAVGVNADYTVGGDALAQVRLYVNTTLLYDTVLSAENKSAAIAVPQIEVKEGDAVILTARSAGIVASEADGNYHFAVYESAGANAPMIANYKRDFNTKRQGDYGWRYMRAAYSWSPEGPTSLTDLTLNSDGIWEGGGSKIDKGGKVVGNETAVVWKNQTKGFMRVNGSGNIQAVAPTESTIAVRIWLFGADGNHRKLKEGFFKERFDFALTGIELSAGDAIAVIFFDNAGQGCNVDLSISSQEQITVDRSALDAMILESKAIRNDDSRYTEDSYSALQSAILTVENAYATLESYEEISSAILTLKNAVKALKISSTAAKADLNAQIVRAETFNGKTLVGGRTEFDNALSVAKAIYAQSEASVEALETATAALKSAVDQAVVKIADYLQDFGAQGSNGWYYYSSSVSFDGGFKVSATMRPDYNAVTMEYALGETFKISKSLMRTDELQERFASIGYRNYTAQTHAYTFKGTAEYIGQGASQKSVLAYVILNANGTHKQDKGDWNELTASAPCSINQKITLEAGEMFLILLRDVDKQDSSAKLTLEVGCNDALTVDKAGLNAVIAQAEALSGDEYTAESFAALTATLAEAKTISGKSDATAVEIENAIHALNSAISALELKTDAVTEALTKAVQEYKTLSSQDFTTDSFAALTEALTTAETVLAKGAEATPSELNSALNALNTAAASLMKIHADYAKDFSAVQGQNGWYYCKTQYVFDPDNKPKLPELLTYDADNTLYKDASNSVSIGKDSIFGGMAEVAWENQSGKTQTFTFKGTIEKIGEGQEAALNFYAVHKSTPEEHLTADVADATEYSKWFGFNQSEGAKAFTYTVELKAGERFVIILRDAGGAATHCKLNLQVLSQYSAA